MKKLNKILTPPLWTVFLLILFSVASLVVIFKNGLEETVLAYSVYPISAYTLTVVCIRLINFAPKHYKRTKERVYANELAGKFLTDRAYQLRVSLYTTLAINISYSALKLTIGIIYSSLWAGAVAVYYIILSLLRFILLRYIKHADIRDSLLYEHKCVRICSVLLMILNLSLSTLTFRMVIRGDGYSYPGFMIYAVAAYTFYSVTISLIDAIKHRKHESPLFLASKAISLATALVSLLTLETAMLAEFGNDEAFRKTMTAATSAGVCTLILALSVFMLVSSSREIKKLSKEQNQ